MDPLVRHYAFAVQYQVFNSEKAKKPKRLEEMENPMPGKLPDGYEMYNIIVVTPDKTMTDFTDAIISQLKPGHDLLGILNIQFINNAIVIDTSEPTINYAEGMQ